MKMLKFIISYSFTHEGHITVEADDIRDAIYKFDNTLKISELLGDIHPETFFIDKINSV
jgi:hypothetical protein